MEELDESADAEEFEGVHLAIQKGDIETVRHIVESHVEEKHFSFEKTSALYKAFQCEEYEIISFLIHKGAKFVGYEDEEVYDFGIDKDRLNHLLFDYNKKSEKSSIYRLMSLSQSPQDLNGERLNAIISMYEHFFRCDVIKSLMKVLENVNFDIVLDFESDKINKVHRENYEEEEIYGLTLSNAMEIFIGAQNLLSAEPKKRAKVHGVVAEELCHLALTTVFNNYAKPYREEDLNLIQEFKGIVLGVKSLIAPSSPIESVIEDVFEYYHPYSWECELIARVPHVLGIYGEESGKRIFQDSSELDCLLHFYEDKVNPKCREYADSFLNTQSDRILKTLTGKVEFISFKEKNILPLKEDFPSFVEYVVVEEGVSVITTNCIKLTALHIYHELKPVYGDQLERKCLFLGGECFEKKRKEILKALKCKLCDYFVLILDNKELHHRRLLCEYLDEFQQFTNQGMNVIIICNSQFLGPEFEDKFLEYSWGDLTDEYKDFRTSPVEYMFKGERKDIFIRKEIVPKLFSEVDIISIISGALMQVHDGADLHCRGYNSETYVEREFQATIIDRNVFVRMPDDTAILIYGLDKWEFKKLSINENRVQWLDGPDNEIKKGKTVFINDKWRPMKFKDFVEKTTVRNRICLQYNRGMFYLMNNNGDVCENYNRKIRQDEEEIVDLLQSYKTLVISENAGCGKSTVISSLMQRVKKKFYKSWVLKVDLNKFSMKDEGPDSEEDGKDDVFEDIFLLLGFRNGIEKCHLQKIGNQEDIFVFLDAFDEIPSKYKPKALRLISFLRNNTDVKMMITTRMHHQLELEEMLNVFSIQLVPFDILSQVNCLEKLWKWKLKFPNGEGGQFPLKDKKAISGKIKRMIRELEKEKMDSENHGLIPVLKEINLEGSIDSIRKKIDDLEFNTLANSILDKTSLDKETFDFMGIPLHLFMVGVIYFDSNFNVEIQSDLYGIYSKFIELKILIYVEEKQGIMHDGRAKKNIIKKETEDSYRIHIELANKFMDQGKLDRNMTEEDLELCVSLGIVLIKGEEVDFLHHTFAEFLRAESLRINFNKVVFFNILFDDKYEVVRRFLSSALVKNKFENIKKDILEDVDFLISVLLRFVHKFLPIHYWFIHYESNLYASDVSKIVKCLLEMFEELVYPDFFNVFIEKMGDELLSFETCFCIGGCLTLKMLKMLLKQNINLGIIFGVVRYYSNPEEVINVLNETISMETAGECFSNDREYENKKAERLLDLFKIEDTYGKGLLFWAIWNVKSEIFAVTLKYFMGILGEERFINKVVQSEKYEMEMEGFINNDDFISQIVFRRISKFLKALHSIFGHKIGILFSVNHKFRILKILCINRLRYSFEEAVGLFIEYFGIEKLKDVLLSCSSEGECLIHILVPENGYVIKNLSIIDNTLDDRNKMKQFLKSKDRGINNIFHFAAKNRDINFDDILGFCCAFLEEDEIKEMLISFDTSDSNVLHLLFGYNSPERILENLKFISNTLTDVDWFKQFLMSKDRELRNVFHCAIYWCMHFGEVLQFFNCNLEKEEIKEMFISRDKQGMNVLQLLFLTNSSERFIENFELIRNTIADDKLFKQCLKSKNGELGNIFHLTASNMNSMFVNVLQLFSEHLENVEIMEMLTSTDEYGLNVLDLSFQNNSSEGLIDQFNLIKNTLADDELIKQCLMSKNGDQRNIFHLAAKESRINFGDFLSFVNENLEKEDIKHMLISADKFGENVLHLLIDNNTPETLIDNFNLIKNNLGDDEWFKQFVKSKNGDLTNVLQLAATKDNIFCDILHFCSENLEKYGTKDMLISVDVFGRNVLQLLITGNSSEILIKKLNLIMNTLGGDKLLFKEFLMSKNGDLWNIFHLAAKKEDIHFGDILQMYSNHLEKDEIKEMLLSGDNCRMNVMHFLFLIDSNEKLIDNLNHIKNTLSDNELFKHILMSKDMYLRNIFHLAAENKNKIEVSFLNMHLGENEIKALLIERDTNGWTCLHHGAYLHSRNLLLLLDYSLEMLKFDGSQFEELILAENGHGNTLLHMFVIDPFNFDLTELIVIIKLLKEKVSDDLPKKLMRTRNKNGETFEESETYCRKEFIEYCGRKLERILYEEHLQLNENV